MLSTKLALVLRDDLPANVAVNAAAVLGLSMGARLPQLLGADGTDADGGRHPGLHTHPVPILSAPAETLRHLHVQARRRPDTLTVGFSEVARAARVYEDYLQTLADTPADGIGYVGLLVYGPRKHVTALTKRLPLLQ